MTKWTVAAPVRVDLAGGTLDIWPLSALVPGAATLNCTLDIGITLTLAPGHGATRLVHGDTGATGGYPSTHEDLALLTAGLSGCPTLQDGWTITLHTAMPRGSGLGTSSVILAALLALDAALSDASPDVHGLVRRAADIEAGLIASPTGIQDYVAPLSGGISHIRFEPGGWLVAQLPVPADLPARTLVAFTGVHHFSGAPNWELVKAWFDRPDTRSRFNELADITADAADAVARGDTDALARAMTRDFDTRTALPAELVPDPIRPVLHALRDHADVTGFRLCGAAGGGSIVVVAEPGRREAVRQLLADAGLTVLPCRPAERRLTIAAD